MVLTCYYFANFTSKDTEFPGVVARPIGNFRTQTDYHYQTLRCNVDLLKIIQLGLTLTDENGNLPPGKKFWQFNFRFSLRCVCWKATFYTGFVFFKMGFISEDMYAQDSIDLLARSGIDFKKHEDYGIDVDYFGELLITSGLVLYDEVKWITFHSGYDFGYLLKVATNNQLPTEEAEFLDMLKLYFPRIYDIKYLMRSCKPLKGGLQDVADELKIPRVGAQHQAGSDSLLTAKTFFKMRLEFFDNFIDDEKFLGFVHGLGSATQ